MALTLNFQGHFVIVLSQERIVRLVWNEKDCCFIMFVYDLDPELDFQGQMSKEPNLREEWSDWNGMKGV